MRIGLEGKVLTPQAGGTGRYAINLLRTLLTEATTHNDNLEFVIFTGPQTSREIMQGLPGCYRERFLVAKSSMLRSLVWLPAALHRERIDVFHGLDHMAMPLLSKRGKYVAAVHDVITLILPHLFTAKHRYMVRMGLARIARYADLVVAPSHATKDDLMRYLHLSKDRIVVIPAGCETRFAPATDPEGLERVRQTYGLPPRYILALGTLEPRKNLPTLLQAFAHLRRMPQVSADLHLVLAGARGWKEGAIFRTCQRLGLERAVVFPGFIAEPDVPDVYRGAACFAFPSLYEGFGFPVLEAMGCGVPVMASTTSSIPEVAGHAALLVDPHDVEAMAEAMYRLVHDEPLRDSLRRQGLAQARRFSWQATAHQMLDLYESLAAL